MKSVRLRRVARAYAVSISIWSVYSLLTVWQFHGTYQSFQMYERDVLRPGTHASGDGATAHITPAPLLDMLMLAEARGLAFALLTPPIFYIVPRYSIGGKHPIYSLLIYLLGVAPFTVCFAVIRWTLCPPFNIPAQTFVPRSAMSLMDLLTGENVPMVLSTYIGIVVAAHAYTYFTKFQNQELDKYAFEQALAASELQVLKMQLHPHFLFNTLNGIGALIDTDGKVARAMVVKLSHLLRIAVDHDSSDLISLRDELKFVAEYLDLEKMRLGDRLRVEWCVDPDATPILVPQMILQPLVENAIRHGIACSRGGGWLEIAARIAANGLELHVRNSIGGMSPGGTGVGLRNTRARLRYLYSDDADVSFVVSRNETATATIRLPALRSDEGLPRVSLLPDADGIKSVKGEHARPDRG